MVPSPKTANALTTLAVAARLLIQEMDTPKVVRDKLLRFTAELRDSLAPELARELDAAEAEAVISSYAGPLPDFPFGEESPQLPRQTPHEPESISADSE